MVPSANRLHDPDPQGSLAVVASASPTTHHVSSPASTPTSVHNATAPSVFASPVFLRPHSAFRFDARHSPIRPRQHDVTMTRRASRRDRLRLDRTRSSLDRSPLNKPTAAKSSSFSDTVSLWIYRYNLSTALYMLEPWERALFNGIVLVVLAYIVYGLYYSALHPLLERFAASYM